MADLQDSERTGVESIETEIARIMQTGAIWLGAVIVAAALLLGPSIAAGWRPTDLLLPFAVIWWVGAVAAAGGISLLVWAGCPVLAFTLPVAYRQKVFSIRVGIVLSLAGMTLGGLAVLLAPVG